MGTITVAAPRVVTQSRTVIPQFQGGVIVMKKKKQRDKKYGKYENGDQT